jgi:hypothetical protein
MFLTCIPLITNYIEQFILCLLAIYRFFFFLPSFLYSARTKPLWQSNKICASSFQKTHTVSLLMSLVSLFTIAKIQMQPKGPSWNTVLVSCLSVSQNTRDKGKRENTWHDWLIDSQFGGSSLWSIDPITLGPWQGNTLLGEHMEEQNHSPHGQEAKRGKRKRLWSHNPSKSTLPVA